MIVERERTINLLGFPMAVVGWVFGVVSGVLIICLVKGFWRGYLASVYWLDGRKAPRSYSKGI